MRDFQRARTPSQRAARRADIMSSAAVLVGEMPVTEVTLTAISAHVGLAKSNVLRYFESREAVLLDLLAKMGRSFNDDIGRLLDATDRTGTVEERARSVATRIADWFVSHPRVCDLMAAQYVVLERNVSVDVVLRFKQGSRDVHLALARQLQGPLPELSMAEAVRAAVLTSTLAAAMWGRSHPADATASAYEADDTLSFMKTAFRSDLVSALQVVYVGLVVVTATRSEARRSGKGTSAHPASDPRPEAGSGANSKAR